MIIKRSREHTVNLGNYENVKIGATVEIEFDSQEIPTQAAIENVNGLLDRLLAEDLKEAAENVPQGQDTHLESWRQ